MNKQPRSLHNPEVKNELQNRLAGKEPAFFLDYDGTLTPIVNDPAAAVLDPDMREVLRKLAQSHKVALISGRDLQTLRDFVQLREVYYAGSHGFDIVGPGNMQKRNQEGEACREELEQAEAELEHQLATVTGCEIERKAFAAAVHYRNVPESETDRVFQAVEQVAGKYKKLRRGGGKKVIELQPDVDWNKGRAVLWLLETLGLDRPDAIPIYMGDDLTDEDAFRTLEGRGIGIYVGSLERPTAAEYQMDNVEQVKWFLDMMSNL